jgi:acyl-coenzyme A thioesterase PaaI-like protein
VPVEKTMRQWRRMLRIMGWWYIPMIGYVRPKLERIDDNTAVISIRLRRRTKNHLKSMYFGALAVGADVAAGLHVFYFSEKLGVKPSFAFKSMKADFHKRAMGTVLFTCEDGQKVKQLVGTAKDTGERQNAFVHVKACTEDGEVVAVFEMEISVKCKK